MDTVITIAGDALVWLDEKGTSSDCEGFIHNMDGQIGELRRLQAKAHAILERKQAEERAAELQSRPKTFPPTHGIGV